MQPPDTRRRSSLFDPKRLPAHRRKWRPAAPRNRERHGDVGALQRAEPGQGAALQGRAVRVHVGRGRAAEERGEPRTAEQREAAGGAPQPGPEAAASRQLGRRSGGGEESDPPVRHGAALLPHPQPPQQGHVLRLRQRPVGGEGGAGARRGPGEVGAEILQVFPLRPHREPESRRLRDPAADGARGEREARQGGRRRAGRRGAAGAEAAGAAAAPAARPAGEPAAAAGPGEERVRPLHPAGQAGALPERPGLRGAVRPRLLRALHPHHPPSLAQTEAVKPPDGDSRLRRGGLDGALRTLRVRCKDGGAALGGPRVRRRSPLPRGRGGCGAPAGRSGAGALGAAARCWARLRPTFPL